MNNQVWKVTVSESESGLVLEERTVSLSETIAILSGYENDTFYKVEAEYLYSTK